jgi:hypothetical protein
MQECKSFLLCDGKGRIQSQEANCPVRIHIGTSEDSIHLTNMTKKYQKILTSEKDF